ncbi:MAG: N-6 DNA methylase, partial [Bacteriovoracales bacterium]|nr:N-6 DNA methylase [Bacteriovoracales bacterium]
MLDQETKRRIDSSRQILVGKIPDPKAQVEQITTALIYKFMDDMDQEAKSFHGGRATYFTRDFKQYGWSKLLDPKLSGEERFNLYISAIKELSRNVQLPEIFRSVFKNVFVPYTDAETLNLFLKEINEFSYDEGKNSESLGNAFEYLLSILGSQGDAGQFRTPRHVIDFIVEVLNPEKGESILDPACGTAGFLISAYRHIVKHNSENFDPNNDDYSFARSEPDALGVQIQSNGRYKGEKLEQTERKKMQENIVGYDISPDMVKLSLVNLYLHKFKEPRILEYDTLTSDNRWDDNFDIILANPPFMSPRGGIRPHNRFSVQSNRSEVLFVDYIAEHLRANGRAGVIVPEGIIFKSDKAYKSLRKMLVEDNFLWAVVSLPAGIFQPYSGVKTSILFFDKKRAKTTDEILFIEVQADGFDLGATRRKSNKNDLPEAFKVLQKWSDRNKETSKIAHWAKKQKIIESGDFNLSGNRYKVDIFEELTSLNNSLKEIIISIQEFQSKAEKASKPLNELSKQAQKTVTPFKNTTDHFQELYKQWDEQVKKIRETTWLNNLDISQEIRDVLVKICELHGLPDLSNVVKIQRELNNALENQQRWPMIELGEVCKIYQPQTISQKEMKDSGEYIVFGANGPIGRYDRYNHEESEVLVTCRGATCGSVNISEAKSWITGNAMVIKPKEKNKLDKDFLYSLLKVGDLSSTISGSAQPQITRQNLSPFKIPLPPLEAQKEIVAEIEGYQKIIDGAKQVVENWKPTVKIDPKWPMVELGNIAKYINGFA